MLCAYLPSRIVTAVGRLSGTPEMNDSSASQANVEAHIRRLEEEEATARAQVDVPALEQLWSDELIINATENIIYTRDHFLLRIKTGQVRFNSFQRKISRIAIKENVAVSMGNESISPSTGPDAGKTVHCSYTNVWIRSGESWQLLGRQVDILARTPRNPSWVF